MKKYLQKLDLFGLLLIVAAVLWNLVSKTWGTGHWALLIAGAVLIIVGVAANYRQILNSMGKRSTKFAGNYVLSLILVIAIVSILNYAGQRHPKRIDTTGSGRYTLAPQTKQLLGKLTRDVEVKAFFPGGEYAPLKELLIEYRTISPRVRYEFIDPDRQPDVAKQYEVTAYGTLQNPISGTQLKFGTVIISYGDRREKIEKKSEEVQEEDLTNAIIKVGRSEAKKIYFIKGHGEKDPADTERTGFSEANKAMEAQGYKVETLNLATEGKVPEDAKVLIEAGPTTEPFAQEQQFIADFLNKGGGGLLLMVDPHPAPAFDAFLKNWGVKVDNDLVLDVSGVGRLMGAGPSIPLVTSYENHKITDRFKAMTFFPLTRSIEPDKSLPASTTVETLFKSNPNSWGETNLNNRQASYDPGSDLKGPLSLAIAAVKEVKPSSESNPAVKSRVVVTGTSNFPVNAYFPLQGNGNLFLNMVSWLAQDEDLISIRPKSPEDRRLVLSESQMSLLQLIAVFALPGIALIVGIVVVVNRRRK
jgi:ABC-type uncharacterized transport system involved in gliding motility auxiliary subunit